VTQRAIQDHFKKEHDICYGCGKNNPDGLHIKTLWDGHRGEFRFKPESCHTAFPGVVYGGLLACLVDCHCIGTAIAASYDMEKREPGSDPAIMFATANLNINYLKPTPMDRELLLKSHVTELKPKKAVIACSIFADSLECVTASVVAVRIP